jgi:hypothetical protein
VFHEWVRATDVSPWWTPRIESHAELRPRGSQVNQRACALWRDLHLRRAAARAEREPGDHIIRVHYV